MELTTVKDLEEKQSSVIITAGILTIKNTVDYDLAIEFLRNVKSISKNIEDYFSEDKKKAAELHKSIVKKEKDLLTPLATAEKIVKDKMVVFSDEQRRIEQELQRQQEQARQIESDRLMKEAADAENKGDTLQAEINMSMAESLVNSNNFTGNTKQAGTRESKELVIVNENLVPRECCSPDNAKIKAYYQLNKTVPNGVELRTKTIIAVR